MYISNICVQIILPKSSHLANCRRSYPEKERCPFGRSPTPKPALFLWKIQFKSLCQAFQVFLMKLAVGIFKTLATYIRLNSDSVSNCIVL